jgi:ribosomal protein S18 acetylase RimI-like enzyme
MNTDDIRVVPYSKQHAKSIADNLFVGVPEDVVHGQREELLRSGPEEVFSVCAIRESMVIGVCTGVRMKWAGSRHRIEMVQVVVHESFRGQGIARRMIQTIAGHFSTLGVEIVQISAEESNAQAIRAYERIGFKRFGTLHNGLKHDDKYSDETMMAALLTTIL